MGKKILSEGHYNGDVDRVRTEQEEERPNGEPSIMITNFVRTYCFKIWGIPGPFSFRFVFSKLFFNSVDCK